MKTILTLTVILGCVLPLCGNPFDDAEVRDTLDEIRNAIENQRHDIQQARACQECIQRYTLFGFKPEDIALMCMGDCQ